MDTSMQAPFDIAADLDTPVSAYMKLKPLKPRFLLESVEGGERLARYSFLGFGDSVDIRFDENGLRRGDEPAIHPQTQDDYLDFLRKALDAVPSLSPDVPGLPFNGGLVGYRNTDATGAVIGTVLRDLSLAEQNAAADLNFASHDLAEGYINTGSQYLAAFAFLPLGLPPEHPFWSSPLQPWTWCKAWRGENIKADKALRD